MGSVPATSRQLTKQSVKILRVHDFLSGLDDSAHGVIRSQICTITPLPDLDSVYQTIVQNETIRSTAAQETPVMSFAAQATVSNYNSDQSSRSSGNFHSINKDPSRKCLVCGKMSHEASACFKVVGFPEWYGDSRQGRGGRGDSGRGRGGRGFTPRANSTQIVGANAAAVTPVTLTEADRQGLTGISDKQWKIIQHMVVSTPKRETLSGKPNCNEWILDTGATHHMTGQVDCLEDIRPILYVSVRLPTGLNVLASRQGTVRLNPQLILHNVFLVDGFDTNLISFGQLVTDNGLVGQITDKFLLLQDRTTKTLIGMGEREREGLYRLCGVGKVTSLHTSVRDDSVLWHHRLGHPSPRIVSLLPGECVC